METAPFPSGVHKLISRFYDLIDPLDPVTDHLLAHEVFAPDGKFIVNSNELSGPKGEMCLPSSSILQIPR